MNIGGRVEAQNSTFSEYGHVAYQIQGNDVYSNMVAYKCAIFKSLIKNHAFVRVCLYVPCGHLLGTG